MTKPRIAYLEDPFYVASHIGWLLRKADRLRRVAPRLKQESKRQECLREVDVLLDRAEDLVRDAIESLPNQLVLDIDDKTKPAPLDGKFSANRLWIETVIKSALV